MGEAVVIKGMSVSGSMAASRAFVELKKSLAHVPCTYSLRNACSNMISVVLHHSKES